MINMSIFPYQITVFQALLPYARADSIRNWKLLEIFHSLFSDGKVEPGYKKDCFQFIFPKLDLNYFWKIASNMILAILNFA